MPYLSEIITGLFGLLVVFIEIRSARWRKTNDKLVQQRAQASKLSMQMQEANLSLAIALALAVENGHTDGDLKEAKEQAIKARDEYSEFMLEITSEQTTKM